MSLPGNGALAGGWAAEQLTAFLAALAPVPFDQVVAEATQRAAEALEAEVAVVISGDSVQAVIGFPRDYAPVELLRRLAEGRATEATLPVIGTCQVLAVPYDDGPPGCFLVARAGDGPFSMEERNLLRGMSRVLALSRREKSTLIALTERQALLERLTRIQRSITSRAPLCDVLLTIVSGAAELVGESVAAFRRIDPDRPSHAVIECAVGMDMDTPLAEAIPIGSGAGGRAISENRLVTVHDYRQSDTGLRPFAERGLEAAMAAPVHEDGVPVGSLVVASFTPGRTFSAAEQETLQSFADHASIAVTDARTVGNLRKALSEAQHDAMHDVLTGLPNRALLCDRLGQALARSVRTGSHVALLFCDLDGFKNINDSLGHDVGDQLLVAVGARFLTAVRDSDTVARLGGDEFAVLLEDIDDAAQAHKTADRLLAAMTDYFDVEGRSMTMNASIGIAQSSGEQPDLRALLRYADLAMYESKRRGGGQASVYQPDMYVHTVDRMNTEEALRRAIENDELVLHYQPIHKLDSRHIVSVEALVRWQHPERGLIGPAEFIPVAESSRLIVPLGDWVLHEACRQAALWPGHIQVAVNVSPRQIDPRLIGTIREILAATGLARHRLKLEVTEASVLAEAPETLAVIEELHDTGVQFAIDDFGTGYSSLARLRRLPVDEIKIDRSFVADLDDARGNVLVSAILALAHGAGVGAVAEGVETDQQLAQLVSLGCERAQGYLLGRPVSAGEMGDLLNRPRIPSARRPRATAARSGR